MFKNMKIEINEQQTLDEVVRELERLGYKRNDFRKPRKPNYVEVDSEYYSVMRFPVDNIKPNTTLAELRSMSVEALKEM